MGGTLAMEFANRYPALVRHLVVMDASGNYGEAAKPKWRERGQTAVESGMHRLIDFQLERWLTPEFISTHPDQVADTLRIFLSNDVHAYAQACEMLGNANVFAHPAPSLASVTVIVGEGDYATPVSMAEEIRDFYPGATLSVIPKTRHFTPIEAPREIAAILDGVLAR
jgi:3-oxoadipate enol-lactonase